MVVLEQADYERLASEIVQGYFQGAPLNDGILKVASESGLNPAQIRQLVWQCNTKTHLELFEKKAEDKMVEFPVADADYILRRLYTSPEDQPMPVKTASAQSLDFFTNFEPVVEKTAADESIFTEEKPISDKTAAYRRGKATRTMRKAASELEQHVYIERECYMDDLHKLAWSIRKDGNRDEFEKDAYALYGDVVLPILNDIRAVYRTEATTAEKIASPVDRLVDDNTPDFTLLKSAQSHYVEAVKYAQALSWLQEKLKDIL